jgi:hypothetical protein
MARDLDNLSRDPWPRSSFSSVQFSGSARGQFEPRASRWVKLNPGKLKGTPQSPALGLAEGKHPDLERDELDG